MSLFGRKKNTDLPAETEQAQRPEAAKPVSAETSRTSNGYAHVLTTPRITEKATMHAERGAYVFNVAPNATKRDIGRAVAALYKVTPRMVRVVSIPSKEKRNVRTGKGGVTGGGKKAYVYLKKGETITLT